MTFFKFKIVRRSMLLLALFSIFSCSKDTDLLMDYIAVDSQESIYYSLAISDSYFVSNQESIVLNVLDNDTFQEDENVQIVETTQPENGLVIINTDKTLTYYPNPEKSILEEQDNNQNESDTLSDESDTKENQQTTSTQESDEITEQEKSNDDTFVYTVEVENKEGEKTTQEAVVKITTDMGKLLAFPGAEGYGKNTIGGRGGYVYHVTNLNNNGPGSLRYGIREIKGPRTIVFDVSGYINWSSVCSIIDPYLTIAGETAPEGGITIKGGGIIVRTSEVIIRNIAIRPGYGANNSDDCISIMAKTQGLHINNVILDHLSLSWSKDENISIVANEGSSIKNVTVQNCLVAEPLKNYGILIGMYTTNISIIKNIWANVPNRIPEATYGYTGESFEFINNIIYNYGRPTTIIYGVEVDIIGNAYKIGPSSPQQTNLRYQQGLYDTDPSVGKIFADDNIQIGQSNPLGFKSDSWTKWEETERTQTKSLYKPISTNVLESTLITDVGSILFSDSIDERILNEYKNGEGIRGPANEDIVGGYPEIKSNSRNKNYDSDLDGISDQWELDNKLDPNNPTDAREDSNKNGYTNLEEFFYHLNKL